jgi:hypothetical protein
MLSELQTEWYVITSAPWAFVGSVAIVSGVAWAIIHFAKAAEVSGLKEQLRLRELHILKQDGLIRDLRPEQTAYAMLSTVDLKQKTFSLVHRLREWYQRESNEEINDRERDKVLNKDWGTASVDAGQQRRKLRWNADYNALFKSEAILLRDELYARLAAMNQRPPGGMSGPGGDYRVDHSSFGSIDYIFQGEIVADYLERAAKLLPD